MTQANAQPAGQVLGAEELAYLVGGAARVAEVALVALIAYERVRISREGLLSVVYGPRPPVSPVQILVLENVGSGGRPAMTALLGVARSKEIHRPAAKLQERRLVLVRTPKEHRKRPLAMPPQRTPAGDAVVRCAWDLARGGSRTGAVAEALIDPVLLAWAAGLVAVGGLTAYPDPAIAGALAAAMARAEADRKASGEGCGAYSCGSSDGGGDGGGGCGGCGS